VFSHQSADYRIVVAHLMSNSFDSDNIFVSFGGTLFRQVVGIPMGRSDESRILLHVTDGRMRVWRHKNTAYTPRNIQPTVSYGGGSVMVWGVSLICYFQLTNALHRRFLSMYTTV
jgi:hypothetical protein